MRRMQKDLAQRIQTNAEQREGVMEKARLYVEAGTKEAQEAAEWQWHRQEAASEKRVAQVNAVWGGRLEELNREWGLKRECAVEEAMEWFAHTVAWARREHPGEPWTTRLDDRLQSQYPTATWGPARQVDDPMHAGYRIVLKPWATPVRVETGNNATKKRKAEKDPECWEYGLDISLLPPGVRSLQTYDWESLKEILRRFDGRVTMQVSQLPLLVGPRLQPAGTVARPGSSSSHDRPGSSGRGSDDNEDGEESETLHCQCRNDDPEQHGKLCSNCNGARLSSPSQGSNGADWQRQPGDYSGFQRGW
jgi:hypothetical protein